MGFLKKSLFVTSVSGVGLFNFWLFYPASYNNVQKCLEYQLNWKNSNNPNQDN